MKVMDILRMIDPKHTLDNECFRDSGGHITGKNVMPDLVKDLIMIAQPKAAKPYGGQCANYDILHWAVSVDTAIVIYKGARNYKAFYIRNRSALLDSADGYTISWVWKRLDPHSALFKIRHLDWVKRKLHPNHLTIPEQSIRRGWQVVAKGRVWYTNSGPTLSQLDYCLWQCRNKSFKLGIRNVYDGDGIIALRDLNDQIYDRWRPGLISNFVKMYMGDPNAEIGYYREKNTRGEYIATHPFMGWATRPPSLTEETLASLIAQATSEKMLGKNYNKEGDPF